MFHLSCTCPSLFLPGYVSLESCTVYLKSFRAKLDCIQAKTSSQDGSVRRTFSGSLGSAFLLGSRGGSTRGRFAGFSSDSVGNVSDKSASWIMSTCELPAKCFWLTNMTLLSDCVGGSLHKTYHPFVSLLHLMLFAIWLTSSGVYDLLDAPSRTCIDLDVQYRFGQRKSAFQFRLLANIRCSWVFHREVSALLNLHLADKSA